MPFVGWFHQFTCEIKYCGPLKTDSKKERKGRKKKGGKGKKVSRGEGGNIKAIRVRDERKTNNISGKHSAV